MSNNELLETVKEWIKIDNEIKVLQKEIKIRKKSKKEVNESLIHIMKDNDIEQCNIPDGELHYKKYKTKAPLSKKHLLISISKYFENKNPDLITELTSFIMDSRDTKEKESIRRKINKK
jgi:hypothetical protein